MPNPQDLISAAHHASLAAAVLARTAADVITDNGEPLNYVELDELRTGLEHAVEVIDGLLDFIYNDVGETDYDLGGDLE